MKIPIAVAGVAIGVAAIAAIARPPHGATSASAGLTAVPVGTRSQQSGDGVKAASDHVVVYVAGEVARSGVYSLSAGSRVDAAVRAAGGPTHAADLLSVNLAEPLTDGEKVLVPARGAAPNTEAAGANAEGVSATEPPRRRRGRRTGRTNGSYTAANSATHKRHGRHRKQPPSAPIDLNGADAAVLETLPGIGPSLAARIVAFRDLNGPFHNADELLDVAGMTDRRLDAISPYLLIH